MPISESPNLKVGTLVPLLQSYLGGLAGFTKTPTKRVTLQKVVYLSLAPAKYLVPRLTFTPYCGQVSKLRTLYIENDTEGPEKVVS